MKTFANLNIRTRLGAALAAIMALAVLAALATVDGIFGISRPAFAKARTPPAPRAVAPKPAPAVPTAARGSTEDDWVQF